MAFFRLELRKARIGEAGAAAGFGHPDGLALWPLAVAEALCAVLGLDAKSVARRLLRDNRRPRA